MNFRHAIRFIILPLFAVFALMGDVGPVSPESLDTELRKSVNDSTLFVRAQLAYSRGLYQNAFDLAERIEQPTDRIFLMKGICSHILTRPHSARAFFARVGDPELLPLAQLGLSEIYCYSIPDPDSCDKYSSIVFGMPYLSRFVELEYSEEGVSSDSTYYQETAEGWTLQFGAFGLRNLADQMAVKVRAEGLSPMIIPVEREGETLYFVYGGVFTTKGEAAARADALAGEMVTKVVELPEKQ